MDKDSCAACDGPLEGSTLTVTIDGTPVAVCCEDCAIQLREARGPAEPRRMRLDRRHFIGLAAGAGALATLASPASPAPASPAPARPAPAGPNPIRPHPANDDRFRRTEWSRRRRFLDNRFGRVAYLDEGGGDAVLFLHGFPLSGFQWRGAVERLSLSNRCIVPDFLGLGWSEPRDGVGVGPLDQMAMLVALLDALGIDRAHVVANDSGGAVAQLLVAHHPGRVRTLLLSNGDSAVECPPAAMLPVIALSKQGRYATQWLDPWYEDPDRCRAPDGLGGMCFADPANPSDAAIDLYLGPLLQSPRRRALVEAYAVALEANALAAIGPQLQRSQVPTRIVWGVDDGIFSLAGAAHLDRAFGASRGVRRLEKARLFWPEERPDIVVAEARALWEASHA